MSQLSGAHRPVTERTPLLLFIAACQMGKKRSLQGGRGGCNAEFLFTCFQVKYTEGKKKNYMVKSAVKCNSLTADLPVGRGQLSPYPGLNTAVADI